MTTEEPTELRVEARRPRRAVHFLAWLALSLLAAFGAGGAAAQLQLWYAPWIVFPLAIGTVVGLIELGLLRRFNVCPTRWVWLVAVVLPLGAVAGLHYFSYLRARSEALADRQNINPMALKIPDLATRGIGRMPTSTLDYLRTSAERGRHLGNRTWRGSTAWWLWGLDTVLVVAGSLAPIAWGLRQPYCSRCQSWYRVVRRAQVPRPAERELLQALQALPSPGAVPDEYRLLHCLGGCGPAMLELTWKPGPREWTRAELWPAAQTALLASLGTNRADQHVKE